MHGRNYVVPLHVGTIGECSGCPATNFEHREINNDAMRVHNTGNYVFEGEVSGSMKLAGIDRFKEFNRFVHLPLSTSFPIPLLCNEGTAMDYSHTLGHECHEQNIIHSVHDDGICNSNNSKDPLSECNENAEVESDSKKGLIGKKECNENEEGGSNSKKGLIGKKDVQKVNPVECGEEPMKGFQLKRDIRKLDLDKTKNERNMVTQSTNEVAQPSSNPKQLLKSSCILKGGQKNDLHSKTQILRESVAGGRDDNVQSKNDQKFAAKHKLKQSRNENMAENNSMASMVSFLLTALIWHNLSF